MGIPEKFWFLFFMCEVFRKLNQFLGGLGPCPPLIGDVANTFAQLLGPSRVFPCHRFGHSKITKSKLQKMQKIQTRPIAISRVLRANSDGPTDVPTDRPTNRRTDKVDYRVACTRLKLARFTFLNIPELLAVFLF